MSKIPPRLPGRWQRSPRPRTPSRGAAAPPHRGRRELTHVAPGAGVPASAHHGCLHSDAPPVPLGAVLMVHHGQQRLLQLVRERPASCADRAVSRGRGGSESELGAPACCGGHEESLLPQREGRSPPSRSCGPACLIHQNISASGTKETLKTAPLHTFVFGRARGEAGRWRRNVRKVQGCPGCRPQPSPQTPSSSPPSPRPAGGLSTHCRGGPSR